jgi:hypothetical protein
MLWTNQLEVATIERKEARDVQAFRCRYYQCVYEVQVGIGMPAHPAALIDWQIQKFVDFFSLDHGYWHFT